MTWLTWRQHRAALIGAAVFVVPLVLLMVRFWSSVQELNAACGEHDCWIGVAGALGSQLGHIDSVLTYGPPVLAGLVAVFWGAPMLSREYEQRTYLVAWGQDVSPGRWLGSRAALLTGAALLLAVPLAAVSWLLVRAMRVSGVWGNVGPYQTLELWPPIPVMHALFGLALGAAIGAVLRRTLLAMGTTLAVFVAVRLAIATTVLRWLPPERMVIGVGDAVALPSGAAQVSSGYLDGAGNPITPSVVCGDRQCLAEHGVQHSYVDYQPFDRLDTLKWTEVIAYGVLTAGLAWLAWARVRRTTRVG
jgi:hypothetical protein